MNNLRLAVRRFRKHPRLTAVVAVMLAVCLSVQAADPADDRVSGWKSDIEFLQSAVKREHFLYRNRPLPPAFQQQAADLMGAISRLSDEQVFAGLQRMTSTLGDGHCYVAPSQKLMQKMPLQLLPVRMFWFTDGLFVIDANPGHEQWIGRRVTRLGKVSADDALRRVGEYVPKDNIQAVRWWAPVVLGYRSTLETLGGLETTARNVSLQFAGRGGKSSEESIGFVPMRRQNQPERKLVASRLPGSPPAPLHLRHTASNFWFAPLPQHRATYVQFNQVLDATTESIEAFAGRLGAHLRQRPPRLLVVDVRHNNGGNADLLDPLVQALQDFERRDPSAKLVVITGPYTFSAAQIFISRMDRVTKAVFAGQPSSSKPNFVGEDNRVELPWSGASVSISNRYHETIPGDTREWIEPELKVELSSQDYFANRDPVLEAVLARYASVVKPGH